jgi:hypothetical protein
MANENFTPENDAEEPVVGDAPPTSRVLFSNKVYDVLKFLALVLLPAVATFYMACAGLWGWENPEKVVGTIVAVDTFLGVVLGLSTKQYNNSDSAFDGHVVLSPDHDAGTTDAQFRIDPASLETGQKQLRLKVRRDR